MNTSPAKFAIALILGVSAMSSQAATPTTFNVMNINRTDGETERLQIDAKLDISLSEEGTLLLVHPEITIEYLISEVETITFDRNDDFSDIYDGDHQSGISAPTSLEDGSTISVTAEAIKVGGNIDIQLYDLKGVMIATCKPENGVATLSTTSLPKGIYIVKAGNSILKIKI